MQFFWVVVNVQTDVRIATTGTVFRGKLVGSIY